ncbi:hypothetical protein QTP70_005670 [Hemibagrus guttatus]|uniref:Lipocalin n=1 Tax=Hemibagrus guttatus TaxID=175788 RepID=A0AAE0PY72_9TELE|nr:hypothetical protein QTP70_005670 [Hemibagrus guttatus]
MVVVMLTDVHAVLAFFTLLALPTVLMCQRNPGTYYRDVQKNWQAVYLSAMQEESTPTAARQKSNRPLVRYSKPVLKQVKFWPAGATSALQDYFECTDWNMFREAVTNGDSINLEEYSTSVTSYIGKCIDDVTISVTVSKTITTRSNQKHAKDCKSACSTEVKRLRLQSWGQGSLKNNKGQTVPSHQRQSVPTPRESTPTFRTAETPGACGRAHRCHELQDHIACLTVLPPSQTR